MSDQSPSIVIYINDVAYGQVTPPPAGQVSGQAATPNRLDPYKVHRKFPERWCAYLRANFRSHHDVQRAFDVSERCARKWWAGETGANGGNVAVAVALHPVEAPRMLFAAE